MAKPTQTVADRRRRIARLSLTCLRACRGTAAFVHRECLNDWRRLSTNVNSYWRCDSCRYNYRTAKLHHLDIFKHPAVISSLALAVLAASAGLLGLAHSCALPSKVTSTQQQRQLPLINQHFEKDWRPWIPPLVIQGHRKRF